MLESEKEALDGQIIQSQDEWLPIVTDHQEVDLPGGNSYRYHSRNPFMLVGENEMKLDGPHDCVCKSNKKENASENWRSRVLRKKNPRIFFLRFFFSLFISFWLLLSSNLTCWYPSFLRWWSLWFQTITSLLQVHLQVLSTIDYILTSLLQIALIVMLMTCLIHLGMLLTFCMILVVLLITELVRLVHNQYRDSGSMSLTFDFLLRLIPVQTLSVQLLLIHWLIRIHQRQSSHPVLGK